MTRRRSWLLPGLALLWALYTFGPILGMLLSTAVAGWAGCELNEGGIYPCVVLGVDIGAGLNFLFVLTWFALVTLPTGLIAGGAALVFWLVRRLAR